MLATSITLSPSHPLDSSPVITSNHSDNHPDIQFVNTINESMLHQHVTKATRDRENQSSTLNNLILTTDPDLVSDIQHLGHLGASDHQCLKFQVNFQHTKAKLLKVNTCSIIKLTSLNLRVSLILTGPLNL